MKIAIVSDIHSNLEALEAVERTIAGVGVDAIYFVGDAVGDSVGLFVGDSVGFFVGLCKRGYITYPNEGLKRRASRYVVSQEKNV